MNRKSLLLLYLSLSSMNVSCMPSAQGKVENAFFNEYKDLMNPNSEIIFGMMNAAGNFKIDSSYFACVKNTKNKKHLGFFVRGYDQNSEIKELVLRLSNSSKSGYALIDKNKDKDKQWYDLLTAKNSKLFFSNSEVNTKYGLASINVDADCNIQGKICKDSFLFKLPVDNVELNSKTDLMIRLLTDKGFEQKNNLAQEIIDSEIEESSANNSKPSMDDLIFDESSSAIPIVNSFSKESSPKSVKVGESEKVKVKRKKTTSNPIGALSIETSVDALRGFKPTEANNATILINESIKGESEPSVTPATPKATISKVKKNDDISVEMSPSSPRPIEDVVMMDILTPRSSIIADDAAGEFSAISEKTEKSNENHNNNVGLNPNDKTISINNVSNNRELNVSGAIEEVASSLGSKIVDSATDIIAESLLGINPEEGSSILNAVTSTVSDIIEAPSSILKGAKEAASSIFSSVFKPSVKYAKKAVKSAINDAQAVKKDEKIKFGNLINNFKDNAKKEINQIENYSPKSEINSIMGFNIEEKVNFISDLFDKNSYNNAISKSLDLLSISEKNADFIKNNEKLFEDSRVAASFIVGNHVWSQKQDQFKAANQIGHGKYGLAYHSSNESVIQVRVPKVISSNLASLLNKVDANLYNLLSNKQDNAMTYLWLNVRKDSAFYSKLITKDSNGEIVNPWINHSFADLLNKTWNDTVDGVDFLVSTTYVKEFVGSFSDSHLLSSFLKGEKVDLKLNYSNDEKHNIKQVYDYVVNRVSLKNPMKSYSIDYDFHSFMYNYGINIAGSDNEFDLKEIFILQTMQEILINAGLYS